MSMNPRCVEKALEILLLTPDTPYPSESGAALRNWGIIRGLHAAGHRITLLTFSDAPLDPETNPLFRNCVEAIACPMPRRSKIKRLAAMMTSAKADIESRLESATFRAALHRLLESRSFDIIQFSGLELAPYLDLLRERKGGAKLVYDALNAEADLQRIIARVDRAQPTRLPMALYSSLQARRIERLERDICRATDAVIAVSEEDQKLLNRHRGAPGFVLPNGIFAAEYQDSSSIERERDLLVFSGKMDYRPNVDAIEHFAEAILPALLQKRPQLKLLIVGRSPHPRLQTLAARHPIEITGRVDSVLPYLQRATLFVLPMRMGSGTRLKILEAMAAGCPVVSTSIGASGLKTSLRGAVAIADDAGAFRDQIESLLDDAKLRRDMAARAQAMARMHYDWTALMPRLLEAYRVIRHE